MFLSQRKILLIVGIALIAASCSTSSTKSPKWDGKGAVPEDLPLSKSGNPSSYVVFGKTYHLLPTSKGYKERGMASWYGDKFHGKPTSSGEPYNMHAYTAAHKTLPIPTFVKVTNTETKKSITVLVNDRGPFVKGRIIDLSNAAAKELDVIQKGTAPVLVEALEPYQYLDPSKKPRKPYKAPKASEIEKQKAEDVISMPVNNGQDVVVLEQQYFDQAPTSSTFIDASYNAQTSKNDYSTSTQAGSYHVQLGSFGSETNAYQFQQSMTNRLQKPVNVQYDKGLYRVFLGNYSSREAAENSAFSLPVNTTIIQF